MWNYIEYIFKCPLCGATRKWITSAKTKRVKAVTCRNCHRPYDVKDLQSQPIVSKFRA